MAVIGTDENDPSQGGALGGGGIALGGGGSSGLITGAAGVGATTKAPSAPGTAMAAGDPTTPSNPGNFTNLQSYLNANQGSAATTGQGVENVLNTAAGTANQANNNYQNSASTDLSNAAAASNGGNGLGVNQGFINQINAGTENVNPTTVSALENGNNTGTGIPGAISTSNPSNYQYTGPTNADQSQFSNLSSYSAPTNVYNQAALTADETASGYANDAQINNTPAANLNLVSSAPGTVATPTGNPTTNMSAGYGGLTSLLQKAYQGPQYTQGEQGLDAFLINGNQDASQAVAQGASNANGAAANYNNVQNALAGQVQGYQNQAAQTNQAYQNAINQGVYTTDQTNDIYNNAAQTGLNNLTLSNLTNLTNETNATKAANAQKGLAINPDTIVGQNLSTNYQDEPESNPLGPNTVYGQVTGAPKAAYKTLSSMV